MTRIKTITDKAQLPPEQQHEWDAILAERGRVRGPFGVMLHSPGLSLGFLGSVAGSHPDGVVSDALHELAILAVAYEDDAPYQWSAHIAAARAAGLGDAAIEAVRTGGDAASWTTTSATSSSYAVSYAARIESSKRCSTR